MLRSLVGSEMCIRDRYQRRVRGSWIAWMVGRVLCLHSFRMSAEALRLQSSKFSNLAECLGAHGELVFVDAPHSVAPEAEARMPSLLREIFAPPYFEWWNARQEEGQVWYDGVEQTLEYIAKVVQEQGPFDGIMGFSQGGSLVHLVCAMIAQGNLDISPPKWAMIISSMGSRHAGHAETMEAVRAHPIQIPALILYGDADQDVPMERTQALASTFETATEICVPGGGHKIPFLKPPEAEVVRRFVQEAEALAVFGC
eukprot:TRINITY_DN7427_c0_g1_i7.p1 TRINITY_DN7427_c0_g1~~TRINITY_DN7427_c0_g1_i7.p1  ORF type:complete len:298 (+),score=84.31 TRINITY_DN7427_c0_g1_i7:129-896(+)